MSFEAFAAETILQAKLRRAVTQTCRLPEAECVAALLRQAGPALPDAQPLAAALITAMRARPPTALAALLRRHPLGSTEGQALMGLAEALLRIPDTPTRQALLRDKLAGLAWRGSLGLRLAAILAASPAWPVVAPLIGLVATRAIGRVANSFVLGESLSQALARAAAWEAKGFRYSYDMLGESALTAEEAQSYLQAYLQALETMQAGPRLMENPSLSIKLSALHPRFTRAQRPRLLQELRPRLTALARLAKARNLGLTIDAEEAERLDLTLDMLEILCQDYTLQGWNGLGLAVQAYQKRAPSVLDFCIDLARRTGRRVAVRLVKGAYWDHEIKQAQTGGFADYPVFTRKAHTDISYIACARKMLAAPDAIFPQFATHNALTIASLHAMAGAAEYEFQCLHGMGEDLYEEVLQRTGRPCRIYAPVGAHRALLPYLARRLLENGANASFINQLHDPARSLTDLVRDPLETIGPFTPHPAVPRPPDMFAPARQNSAGLDLADEGVLWQLADNLASVTPDPLPLGDLPAAFAALATYQPPAPATRHAWLAAAAALLEQNRLALLALLVTEAGKTFPAALSEIRETVDFCRYYGALVQAWPAHTHTPLGLVACISPFNFPLAIFIGQIAGALAAGNAVLAKPAGETPRIAALAVNLLHQAGIPASALQLVLGDGACGAALVADARVQGVLFTGGLEAAHAIHAVLAQRLNRHAQPVPFIAETGGLNAMVADSSALAEHVVADAVYSAFDSAGQRCSALRLLCLQEEAAPLILPRLRGAMAELRLGPPDRLETDIGPVISLAARDKIHAHISALRATGCRITQGPALAGAYVAPCLIELNDLAPLQAEIFGPVLHVLIYQRANLPTLLRQINQLGYGLTFGLQTRLMRQAQLCAERINAGNIYINRNMVGAVVGLQPFGGRARSGTGPKAGGPLYLQRLLAHGPALLPRNMKLAAVAGERNEYILEPRGVVLCIAKTAAGRRAQRAACGMAQCRITHNRRAQFSAILLEAEPEELPAILAEFAKFSADIRPVQYLTSSALARGAAYNPAWLLQEKIVTTNIMAAGGNAALVAHV